MGIQDIQAFLDSNCVPNGVVPVDLLKIARKVIQRQRNRSNKNHSPDMFRIVLDAECCLDRLYGGYFSDWVCGGQWNRMVQFLAVLIQATEMSGVELAIYFNGCNEVSRRSEWIENQLKMRTKVNNVLKHITTKGTPPPKIWWSPPVCLRTSLRMALRHLKVSVMCTIDDHHQEVITYCRETNINGLMADDAEYAVFDPPRYFSSEQLKLTYKGSLETKEYIVSELTKSLGIPADRLCILAALLGNHILTEVDLSDFYKKLNIINTGPKKTNINQSMKLIGDFVKDLPSIDLDAVAQEVFGTDVDPRCSLLRQSAQYYMNGTKDGFLHFKSIEPLEMAKLSLKDCEQEAKQFPKMVLNSTKTDGTREENHNLGTSRFASETIESERESLNAYNEATASAKVAPQIVIESPVLQTNTDGENVKTEDEQSNGHAVNGTHNLLISSSSSSSSSLATSPSRVTTDPAKQNGKQASIPESMPEVMRTASERHQKGLMSPHIYQILVSGVIKLPVLLEDENNREFPSIHLIYRPVRQMVYAILFNLHHKIYLATRGKEKKDERSDVPDVVIREWIWSKENPYEKPEHVKAEQIGWGVPTIQRLWFGTGIDDKRRRLRGFLTCMKSDTPMMLNISYVPQHLLVMACVLRYIMSFSDKMKILRRQELDAFIAQAFSPDLMNAQYLQDLQLPLVTFRGVQLATLFMAGVETALFANDACGAPIPWLMCCPWLYFDGKLFHYTLARAAVAKNLLELCGGHIDRVVKVERMRKAILEGIDISFARPPIVPPSSGFRVPPVSSNIFPNACNSNPALAHGRKIRNNIPLRELIRRPVPSRGGQLAIAGVIVGQWGANYGQPVRLPQSLHGPSRERLQSLTPFPRMNSRMAQPRGNNWSSLVTRKKKTQMKATSKKKIGFKRNQENGNKQHEKSCDKNVEETANANGFSKLLRKDMNTKEIIPSFEKKSDQTLDNKFGGKVQDDSAASGSQSIKEN